MGHTSKGASFLHRNSWCEALRESAEIFDLNYQWVVPGFMNLCNLSSVLWFLTLMNNFDPTWKQFTKQVYSVISMMIQPIIFTIILNLSSYVIKLKDYLNVDQLLIKFCHLRHDLVRGYVLKFQLVVPFNRNNVVMDRLVWNTKLKTI